MLLQKGPSHKPPSNCHPTRCPNRVRYADDDSKQTGATDQVTGGSPGERSGRGGAFQGPERVANSGAAAARSARQMHAAAIP